MNKTKLVKFVGDLEAIIYDPDEKKRAAAKSAARAVANHLRTDSIDMLLYDIETQYTAQYESLGSQYVMAWDLVVGDRLDAIMLNYTGGTDKHKAITDFRYEWRRNRPNCPPIGLVHFGQLRANSDFAGARTEGQNKTIGVPSDSEMNGRPLPVVAGRLSDGSLKPDQSPIKIFYSETHGKWVAINNRSYAIHCLAGVRPLRYWPSKPTQDEVNRLNDQWDKKQRLKYSGLAETVVLPRTLPSLQVPLTAGVNDLTVTAIAKVPSTFALEWR